MDAETEKDIAETEKDIREAVALKNRGRVAGRRSITIGGMLRPLANRSGVRSVAPGVHSANEVPVTRDRSIDLGVLALAVVVGTVLRVVGLGAVGLNSDEAVYAGQAASL